MNRVIRGFVAKKRRKKILNFNSGFFGSQSRLYTVANQQYMKSKVYSYFGRKAKKRAFRKLWITRLSSTLRPLNYKYSNFSHRIKNSMLILNRKVLSKVLLHDNEMFQKIINFEVVN